MKKWLFYLFLYPFFGSGQNLIPNNSFEDKTACPSDLNQFNYCTKWDNTLNSSIDYYHMCSPNTTRSSIPKNTMGYQYPKSDSAYAGLAVYAESIINAREYLEVELLKTLVKNNLYQIEFYLSLNNNAQYAISNIGVFFSQYEITSYCNQQSALSCIMPQVSNSIDNIFSDTLSWMKFSGYYLSNGGENFIVIGNFNPDSSTNRVFFNPSAPYPLSGYYIDDVSLIEVPAKDAALKNIEKRDSCFTVSDTLWVQLQNRGVDSLDFTQEPLPYLVEVRKNGNVVQSFVDSIQTNQYNTGDLPLPLDSSIWFPIAPINLSDLGKNYQINIELQWDLDEDSTNNQIDITLNTALSVGLAAVSEDTVCFGDEVQLTTANYKGAIQWQSSLDQTQWQSLMPGDTVQHKPTQKTHYRLAVCDTLYSDTFEVEVIHPKLAALGELQFCSEEQTIKIKRESTFSTLRWYTDSNSNSFFYEGISLDTTLKVTKTFYLAAVLNGCESEERVPLKINISCDIKIPNVFTPNGDGINDLFLYRNVDESKTLQTKIYNRWGDVVSQWIGNKGWNGEGLNEGVYYYEVYYGKEKITGVVSLIRD